MGQNLYVGNLAYRVTEEDLRDLFGKIGEVESVNIIMDRETGRPRGFGFVKMAKAEDAARAVDELNSRPFQGRALVVNEARPRAEGGPRREGGFGGGNRPSRRPAHED